MDNDVGWEDENAAGLDAAAFNTTSGAYYRNGCLAVLKPGSSEDITPLLPGRRSKTTPILALSYTSPNLLAVSDAGIVRVYDLSASALLCTLLDLGRTVTAISWSRVQPTVLAFGCVNSSISLVDTRTPSRPYLRLGACNGVCHHIAFHGQHAHVLATLDNDNVSIWNLERDAVRPVGKIRAQRTSFVDLAWQPGGHQYLTATTSNKELRLYDASRAASIDGASPEASPSDSDDSDNSLTNGSSGYSGRVREVVIVDLESYSGRLQWINSDLFLLFDEQASQATVLELNRDDQSLSCLWRCKVRSTTTAVQVQHVHGTACLVAIGQCGLDIHDLPATLLNRLRSTKMGDSLLMPSTSQVGDRKPSSLIVQTDGGEQAKRSATMKPVSITSQRLSTGFAHSSRQLQQRLRRRSIIQDAQTVEYTISKPSIPSQPRSMTSSLELPKPDNEHDSPMPFLSPGVPARGSPQTVIASLNDSILELPPLPTSSFDSSLVPQPALQDDDDSDDETFVDKLQGSGTFLPGGINVPLPKACGALWASNGQLLTFFPPKARMISLQREAIPVEKNEKLASKSKQHKTATLFPKFGNLVGGDRSFSDDAASSVSGAVDEAKGDGRFFPDFQLPPSSLHSQHSWLARISPVKHGIDVEQANTKVNIAIRDIGDMLLPFKTQRLLAEEYQLLREEDDSGAAVCERNAEPAEAVALTDTALIWRLLGLLLEDKVPLEAMPNANNDESVLAVANKARMLKQAESGVDMTSSMDQVYLFGHFRWADDPFGGLWLVRRIFEWAEAISDVQHLACFAAVLAEADQIGRRKQASDEQSFYKKLPTYGFGYLTDALANSHEVRPSSPRIPVFRRRTPTDLLTVYESPNKLHQKSHAPSRTPSQPTTPFLDSASTTPPFSFPPLSRQGSRLSTAGSASPEAHRSSFSAAAKYYAQSITDKFSSYGTYGTSPPVKKTSMSVSPSNNELSTSLPTGSWSKSVSFAASSTTANTTTRGSLLSTSYEEQGLEDPYDSDKTVEDSSLPHTPKSGTGDIIVTHKNQHAFGDEVSGGAKTSLLPDDLARKAQFWVQYYAEQLRIWGLLVQATELENMVRAANVEVGPTTIVEAESIGVAPVLIDNALNVDICVICATVLLSTEQICLSCLHTSHVGCLVDYIGTIDHGNFTCPAGCGCRCSELEHVVEEAKLITPTTRPSLKKKLSFTDPRRWRARAEENSW